MEQNYVAVTAQKTNRERKCAEKIGAVLVPRAGCVQKLKHKYIFQIKTTEAILSSSTQKLL